MVFNECMINDLLKHMDDNTIENIEIKLIHPSQFFMRQRTQLENSYIQELAASIQQYGLLQPIIVRAIHNGLEIVAGHRRFSACKSLKMRYIPCIIKDLTNKEAFEVQLIENIQRRTLDPIEEAEAFSKYVLEYGWGGVSELARRVGKSEEYVSHRIQLLKLPKDIQNKVSRKELSVSHALEIVNIDPKEQRHLSDMIIKDNLSVQHIRELKKSEKALSEDDNEIYYYYKDTLKRAKKPQIFKKTVVSLKLALYRLDSLIEEANKVLDNEEERADVVSTLMQIRLKIHSLIDDALVCKNA